MDFGVPWIAQWRPGPSPPPPPPPPPPAPRARPRPPPPPPRAMKEGLLVAVADAPNAPLGVVLQGLGLDVVVHGSDQLQAYRIALVSGEHT